MALPPYSPVAVQVSVEVPVDPYDLILLAQRAYGDKSVLQIERTASDNSIVKCCNRHDLKNFLAFVQLSIDKNIDLSNCKITFVA